MSNVLTLEEVIEQYSEETVSFSFFSNPYFFLEGKTKQGHKITMCVHASYMREIDNFTRFKLTYFKDVMYLLDNPAIMKLAIYNQDYQKIYSSYS